MKALTIDRAQDFYAFQINVACNHTAAYNTSSGEYRHPLTYARFDLTPLRRDFL